jgi:oligopeptide transport system substrate-binding protein
MRRRTIRAVCVSLIAALIAGCGGPPGEQEPTATPIGGASGRELADRQVLRVGNGSEPQSLDPHRSEGTPSAFIQMDLFEGLVDEAPDGELVPGAAESWDVSADAKTYTFHLRRNARWSNGDPVTAQDFVYSLRRSADPATQSHYTFILSPIVNAEEVAAGERPPSDLGVRAIDDYTLEIRLNDPTPYFLGLLTHSATYPVHRASVERYGERFTRPGNLVSNGAYRLADWVVQSHIKLTRNPYYWDDAHTTIDEVWFYPTEDQDAELRRFRANELDITYTIPMKQLAWIRKNLPDELEIAPYLGTYYYGFNLTKPPFENNPKLRRALALAVDRDIITKDILGAGQLPAYGWVPPVDHYIGQQMPEAAWTQAEREAEAKRLYAEAGYSAEHPLHVQIMYNTQQDHKRIAVAIASMWQRVLGVRTSILNQEWKVFLDTVRQKQDTQVFRMSWIGDYDDAFTFAERMGSGSGLNDTGYSNPEYDRLLAASQKEGDPDKRAAILEHAERVLLADLPIMPLYFYVSTHMVKPWVGGYEGNIMDHHHHKDFFILKH